ncbi:mycofactocin system GMC family oxidoreductase MftG [Mycolicibacterium peregrinum]|uniref:mycofactocin dehydrogenase MftG n=1 Tax=Mycolicibacterium peregrinum TaxID=43304 RepID=UPI0006D7F83E|nr:mycofactocin system GMC family oxidoreductase MftG [Mycolicibacterium peregrinum]MCV7206268.1 mycofactocin system GMC family oxidoreductase MftG [Mycolicibacterium peregrinum]ORW57646.1 glucose-methanol-choline oxidoreductase [Mycolicibacterium peregrinum]OWM10930.1 mycofactocin system GMC family oxidoreductase MftG [Mycolicibacterium peregrinum]
MERDVLIVGAGSAGSILAERLSVDPSCHVTVVEAGPAPSDPRVAAQITDALRLPIGAASSVVRHYASVLTERPPRHTEIIRGSVVGGSGAVNGGYFCRGLPGDFDRWAVPGWGWDDVLPHFRAIETDLDFDTSLHGDAGPITVRRVREFDGCTASFVDAAKDAGFGWIDDLNGSTAATALPAGVGAVPLNINGGNRVGPGGAYLQPALGRTNLQLVTDTRVHRVLFRANRAVGVQCEDGAVLSADRIVLCSGAIGSAHLLLLSGIGPVVELEALGIEVVADLPVGMHTVDHPEWVLPVSWTPSHDLPPLEAVLTTDDGIEVRPYTAGFSAMVHGPGHDPAELPHLGVALMRPHSRGRVGLASADPTVAPVIEHRYDTVADDVDALRRGAELARELVSHTAEVGEASWSTSQHLAGTAPMGTGAQAVLDPTCRVLGVENLWVVDGSIMPAITSRGPHATIAMIGHRAAEFLAT